jgi:hypothetical protein
MDTPPPNCWDCRHFRVTRESLCPYSCKKMGFKSARLPSEEVLKADGRRCRGFSSKASATGEASGVLYFRQ